AGQVISCRECGEAGRVLGPKPAPRRPSAPPPKSVPGPDRPEAVEVIPQQTADDKPWFYGFLMSYCDGCMKVSVVLAPVGVLGSVAAASAFGALVGCLGVVLSVLLPLGLVFGVGLVMLVIDIGVSLRIIRRRLKADQ